LCQAQKIADVLIDAHVALVFIDGAHEEWRSYLLAAKNNAATRRIPVCFISDEEDQRADAVTCGTDLALSWSELGRRISQIINDIARIPDPAILELLACECAEPLPDLAIEGAREFNRGEFYRQHDLFEAQWVKTTGPVRDLYRAILQVGVAYYQIERGNYRGALKMLQRSVQWLTLLPDRCQGIDVEQLRRDSYAVRAELQRLGPERLGELDRRLLKKLKWNPLQSDKR
jgi:predicted metal-dependent hydrolase